MDLRRNAYRTLCTLMCEPLYIVLRRLAHTKQVSLFLSPPFLNWIGDGETFEATRLLYTQLEQQMLNSCRRGSISEHEFSLIRVLLALSSLLGVNS